MGATIFGAAIGHTGRGDFGSLGVSPIPLEVDPGAEGPVPVKRHHAEVPDDLDGSAALLHYLDRQRDGLGPRRDRPRPRPDPGTPLATAGYTAAPCRRRRHPHRATHARCRTRCDPWSPSLSAVAVRSGDLFSDPALGRYEPEQTGAL